VREGQKRLGHQLWRANLSCHMRWRDRVGPTGGHASHGQTFELWWRPLSCRRIWRNKVVQSCH
jgi:hypothetical protein